MKVDDVGKRGFKPGLLKLVSVLVFSALAVAVAAATMIIPPYPSSVRLAGIVTDSVCGGDHGIKAAGDPGCTRACVEIGADYALMVGKLNVGKKMYVLHGHEADLYRFAGREVIVKGRTLGRNTIIVDQVDRSYYEVERRE